MKVQIHSIQIVLVCTVCVVQSLQGQELVDALNQLESSLRNVSNTLTRSIEKPAPEIAESIIPTYEIKDADELANILDKCLKTIDANLKNRAGTKVRSDQLTRLGKESMQKIIQSTFNENAQSISTIIQSPQGNQAIIAILTNLATTYIITQATTQFEWCACIRPAKRLACILFVVAATQKQYPNKDFALVYTSLGSGQLLQDYLQLYLLIQAGYKNITANLIDLAYPQAPRIIGDPALLHEEFLQKKPLLSYEQQFSDMEQRLKQLGAYIYIVAYKYPTVTKTKSHILLMVDPGVNVDDFTIEPYPSLATILGSPIGITEQFYQPPQTPEEKPTYLKTETFTFDGYIFLPRFTGISIYTRKIAPSNALIAIINIGAETNAFELYNPSFITKLMEEHTIGTIAYKFLQPTEKTVFRSDPHLTFQELAVNATDQHAIIVSLFHHDPTVLAGKIFSPENPLDSTAHIRHITDITAYAKEDVVTPNSGRYLNYLGYFKINPKDYVK